MGYTEDHDAIVCYCCRLSQYVPETATEDHAQNH